ncbi:MAG: T9SS type A sorting domain-containing protein [Bacteroidota bacterium]
MKNRILLFTIMLLLGFCPIGLQAQLKGGEGDGYAASSFVGLLNGDSLKGYTSGGQGDGFGHSRRGGFLQGPGISDPLQGGEGDGFSTDDFVGLLSGLSTRTMFSSGDGDGFAHARSTGFLQGVAFPIELLSFEAALENDWVYLRWITASEQNHDYFTIERSKDGNTFDALVQVPGSGTSLSPQTYQSIDRTPLQGYSYYRLKSTDLDGSITYSKLVAIQLKAESSWKIKAFPNPNTGEKLSLQLSGMEANKALQLELIDVRGRTVYQQRISPTAADYQTELVFTQALPQGGYLLRLSSDDQQMSKLILVR